MHLTSGDFLSVIPSQESKLLNQDEPGGATEHIYCVAGVTEKLNLGLICTNLNVMWLITTRWNRQLWTPQFMLIFWSEDFFHDVRSEIVIFYIHIHVLSWILGFILMVYFVTTGKGLEGYVSQINSISGQKLPPWSPGTPLPMCVSGTRKARRWCELIKINPATSLEK